MARKTTRGSNTEAHVSVLEKLARLEHNQWMYYSKDVAKTIRKAGSLTELQNVTFHKWRKNWKPYQSLSEEVKAKDRVWAKKVVKLITDNEKEISSLFSKKT